MGGLWSPGPSTAPGTHQVLQEQTGLSFLGCALSGVCLPKGLQTWDAENPFHFAHISKMTALREGTRYLECLRREKRQGDSQKNLEFYELCHLYNFLAGA